MQRKSYSAVGYTYAKEIFVLTPNLKFDDSVKAANFVTEYSNIVENDEKLLLSEICDVVKCKDISEIKPELLMSKSSCTKDKMAKWIHEIAKSFKFANDLLKVANSTIVKLQGAAIRDKDTIIKLQEKVITNKTDQLETVTSAVQSEMKSYCDIVKRSCSESVVTQEKLKKAVKTVVKEEDKGKNIMVFGLHDEKEEDLSAKIDELMVSIGQKPCIQDSVRLGTISEGSGNRPIKVVLRSSDSVQMVLSQARILKGSGNFKHVYISPDRTREERTAHQQLVKEMKIRIQSDPNNYHYIRNGTIMSKVKQPNDKD